MKHVFQLTNDIIKMWVGTAGCPRHWRDFGWGAIYGEVCLFPLKVLLLPLPSDQSHTRKCLIQRSNNSFEVLFWPAFATPSLRVAKVPDTTHEHRSAHVHSLHRVVLMIAYTSLYSASSKETIQRRSHPYTKNQDRAKWFSSANGMELKKD